MSEQTAEPTIPLRLPVSYLRVIIAALGKLPLEVAGPVDAYIKNQINQLAAMVEKQNEDAQKQKSVPDAPAPIAAKKATTKKDK